MAATINGSFPLDNLSAPSGASSRREVEGGRHGERFDAHFERAMDTDVRPTPDRAQMNRTDTGRDETDARLGGDDSPRARADRAPSVRRRADHGGRTRAAVERATSTSSADQTAAIDNGSTHTDLALDAVDRSTDTAPPPGAVSVVPVVVPVDVSIVESIDVPADVVATATTSGTSVGAVAGPVEPNGSDARPEPAAVTVGAVAPSVDDEIAAPAGPLVAGSTEPGTPASTSLGDEPVTSAPAVASPSATPRPDGTLTLAPVQPHATSDSAVAHHAPPALDAAEGGPAVPSGRPSAGADAADPAVAAEAVAAAISTGAADVDAAAPAAAAVGPLRPALRAAQARSAHTASASNPPVAAADVDASSPARAGDDAAPTGPSAAGSTAGGSSSASAFAAAAGDLDQPSALGAGPSAGAFIGDADGDAALVARGQGRGLPVSVPQLSIDLSDEGLGPLTLQALQGAGVVHLKLTAADPVVGDLLARAGGDLRRDLEAGGTAVGTLDIGHDQGRGDSAATRDQQQPTRQRTTSSAIGTRAVGRTPSLIPAAVVARTPRSTVADGVDVRI